MASVWYLVVASGGGGGVGVGGGGGGGGFRTNGAYDYAVALGAYTVTIGAGGTTGVSDTSKGTNGANAVFDTITATGGGGGAVYDGAVDNGLRIGANGGSGGGGAARSLLAPGTGGTGVAGQGSAGGTGSNTANTGGAGGGGSSAVGADGTAGAGGAGGAGTASSISGASVTYAGGGGGGGFQVTTTGGAGGAGGGGAGSQTGVGTAGTANTGGGGGGGGFDGSIRDGGSGGTGVVIIRYVTADLTATGGTITTDGSHTVHTFTVSGTFTVTDIPLPPVAAFSGTPLSGTAPLTVDFTDASTNTPTSWLWEKNDGSGWVNFAGTPTAQNPSEVFAAGTWSVRLTATNAAGSDAETKTDYITLSAADTSDTHDGGHAAKKRRKKHDENAAREREEYQQARERMRYTVQAAFNERFGIFPIAEEMRAAVEPFVERTGERISIDWDRVAEQVEGRLMALQAAFEAAIAEDDEEILLLWN